MTHTPASHPLIKSGSIEYSNHHLQPFRHALAGHGAGGSDLIIRVSFTCHVYSRQDSGQPSEFRFIDEGGRWREFCPTRHQASLDLPGLCATLMDENFPSWRSKDRNGQSNMAVTERQPASGYRYAVFYYLYPSRAEPTIYTSNLLSKVPITSISTWHIIESGSSSEASSKPAITSRRRFPDLAVRDQN